MAKPRWQDAVNFYSQMRHLMHTGLTLDQALPLVAGRGPYAPWARSWAAAVAAGEPWHQAMQRSGERPLICALIAAGERSGHLEEMCREIEDFYQHCVHLKRLIIGRSIYPILLIHVAMVMPGVVAVVGGAGIWVLIRGPLVLWACVLILVIAWSILRGGAFLQRLACGPGLGALTRQLVCSNAALVLRAGASAGLLYPQALELAAGSCGNGVYADRLRQQATAMTAGDTPDLGSALERVGLPSDMVAIVTSAEQAGAVERALQQVAVISRERFQSRLQWSARIATGTLLAIAMLIAVITIISMFMNIYIAPMQELLRE